MVTAGQGSIPAERNNSGCYKKIPRGWKGDDNAGDGSPTGCWLKVLLLKLFVLSELEKADRLLNGLGYSKASELMERYLAMLGLADPFFHFIHIFLQQLPAPVHTALASSRLAASKD